MNIALIIIIASVETIIDYILFKFLRFKLLSFIMTFVVGFLVPATQILLIMYSGLGPFEKLYSLTDFLTVYLMNLPEYLIGYIGALFASFLIYAITGERFESP